MEEIDGREYFCLQDNKLSFAINSEGYNSLSLYVGFNKEIFHDFLIAKNYIE